MGLKKVVEPIPPANRLLTWCQYCKRDVVAKIYTYVYENHREEFETCEVPFCVNCHECVG